MLRVDGSENGAHRDTTGVRAIVADDDAAVRSLFGTLLRAVEGVSSVLEVEDGAEAVRLARDLRIDIAVLDLNMPGPDGVETAVKLRQLQPSIRVALHSSDPDGLRARATGFGMPLFDKLEFDRLVGWARQQAIALTTIRSEPNARISRLARKLELSCSLCGYGILSREPPARCPMCQASATWIEPSLTRDAAAHVHVTG